MAPSTDKGGEASRAEEQVEEEEKKSYKEEAGEDEAPSHLPLAPTSELLDISTTIDPSYIISLIRQLLPRDPMMDKQSRESEVSTASLMDNEMNQETKKEERNGVPDGEGLMNEKARGPWEDSGCILWDLAASITHAELMVNNFIIEVLLVNLHANKSFRIVEICLGIIGNLSCHEVLRSAIVSKDGLVEAVIDRLFLDDSACLSETFRVLTSNLQGGNYCSWAEALLPDQVLIRILWITENTLNPSLFEKSIEFLLTIIGNQEVGTIMLGPLLKLGLINLIVSLLACQISKLGDDMTEERLSALDLILQLIETLSATDDCFKAISSNSELFDLVCRVVKLPEKVEASSSCVSAVVCIANHLADQSQLRSRILYDFQFLEGILDILPFVSEDSQARGALWCVLESLLIPSEDIAKLHNLALVLLRKSHLIEEDLDGHDIDSLSKDLKGMNVPGKPSALAATSLRNIACIIEKWRKEESTTCLEKDGKAQKLLSYCQKYNL